MTERPALKPLLSLSVSGEVSTKSAATRKRFHQRLCANLRAALRQAGFAGTLVDRRDRIDVHDAPAEAAPVLARVFGVQSVRVAHALTSGALDQIAAAGEQLFADRVAGRRFAVRPRRVGNIDHHRVSTTELARDLGQRLVDAGGRVDLDDPEVAVHVELRPGDSVLFTDPLAGPGGLPVGTEGRALALISGGFDSAVAAWQMMLRGLELDFVLFSLAGPPQETGVMQVLRALEERWLAGSNSRLYIVDFRPLVAELRSRIDGSYWQVLLKRLMLRAAESVARRAHAGALVTGEALGQVSSQTLTNLGAIDARSGLPVLRPLIGLNKEAILERARAIGTHEASAGNAEFCALEGGRPVTRSRAGDLDRHEARIDRSLLDRLVAGARVIARDDWADFEAEEVALDHVPADAAVIDLRDEHSHRQWAWPGAIHLDFDRACEFAAHLPKDRRYLLYCEFGLKSAWLAEAMRRAGFDAAAFAGGIRRLKAHARRAAAHDDRRAPAR